MLQPTELPQEAPASAKKAKWKRLETIAHVRQALAAVIKKTYDGKMDPFVANACVNGLRVLGKTLHDSEVEERLKKLEDKLSGVSGVA